MKTIAIAGTFDTKGTEFLYVKKLVQELGLNTLMIHTGVFEPAFQPDVENREIAAIAGYDIDEIVRKKDRALATEALSKGMEILIPKLYKEGKFDGILSFGGSGGTALVTPAMRALPIGVPKMMVSTMASGNVSQYVGCSDIVMMPSIVDVAGLNSISRIIFQNGVQAMAGMVKLRREKGYQQEPEIDKEEKRLVAATMFGVTTPCVGYAKDYLEQHGCEVLVFHATGTGGKTMENLIANGFFEGVLDMTTTEWCDELVGGVLAAGPNRCEAAALHRIPQVVSVGALDMVNFGPYDTVPEKFQGRLLYRHNPSVTLMRTTVDENRMIGEKLSEKLNMASGNTVLMLPLKGVSALDGDGQPFDGSEEDNTLFDTLRTHVNRDVVELVELDCHINDRIFAETAAQKLLDLMKKKPE